MTKLNLKEHHHQSKRAKVGEFQIDQLLQIRFDFLQLKEEIKSKEGGRKEAVEILQALRHCSFIRRKKKREAGVPLCKLYLRARPFFISSQGNFCF